MSLRSHSRRTNHDDQLRSLEARLIDGYARIEQARAEGLDIDQWETFWIQLLAQYEAVYDERYNQEAA